MRFLIKLILCSSLATSSLAYAQPAQKDPSRTWMEEVCRQGSKESCVMAYGWHWLRKSRVVIDPALKTMQYAGLTWLVAKGASYIIGETPEIVFVLTVSRTGIQAGTILLIGGVAVAVIGTLASAAGFLLGGTRSTAGKEQDEFLTMCKIRLEPFQGAEGVERLSRLTPAEMEQLLPCIPHDRDLSDFLKGAGEAGQAADLPPRP